MDVEILIWVSGLIYTWRELRYEQDMCICHHVIVKRHELDFTPALDFKSNENRHAAVGNAF